MKELLRSWGTLFFGGAIIFFVTFTVTLHAIRNNGANPITTHAERDLFFVGAPKPSTVLDVISNSFPILLSDTGTALLIIDANHQVWIGKTLVGTITNTGWIPAQ